MDKSICIQKREDIVHTAPESGQGGSVSGLRYQDLKSAPYIEAIIRYAEPLLTVRFKHLKKNRYSAPCPFHADTNDSFAVYVNKTDEIRFHCFGACRGDWDIYDLIMLRKKYGFKKAQQVWAEHLGITDFKFDEGRSPGIPEPDETPEPDDIAGFAEPKKIDEKMTAVLNEAARFYNDLLMSNEYRFKYILDFLACRGIDRDAIRRFTIGFAPPYSDEQHLGRALITAFSPRFEKDDQAFKEFSDIGLVRFLNDNTVKGYGYYCRQINVTRKDQFSRNYGDYFSGQIVFPVYDADGSPTGLVGRRPGDRGVRWLKHQTREEPLSAGTWLYGIEKAGPFIRKYRTIILTEGLFDYFACYNLLHGQNKAVVVSTLGSYLTHEAAAILKDFDIENYIAAYDWDELGRNGIERIAAKTGGWVYYLGGLADGQDPYDILKPVINGINGFSLKPPENLIA